MECLWRLFGYWQPDGDRHIPDPAIFYVRFPAYYGFTHSHLHDPGFLEEYAKIYVGSKEKSLVLFVTVPPFPDLTQSLGTEQNQPPNSL